VNNDSGKRFPPPPRRDEGSDRDINQPRRVGRIVHDERGVASVEWRNAPKDFDRQVFELEQTAGRRGDANLRKGFELTLEVKKSDTFNPYEREGDTFDGRRPMPGLPPKSAKRDLRKLSEWIKQMKAMEERKKNSTEDE
jgi:hypothetical protein